MCVFRTNITYKMYSQKHRLAVKGPRAPKISSVSGRHFQFSSKDRKGGEIVCPGSFNGSSVNVAVVAFPEAKAKRVEVKFTSAVVAEELPLLLVLSQRETRVGILHQELLGTSSPEGRQD